MLKKLLFVLSGTVICSSLAFAQNADLKKTFNPNAPVSANTLNNSITALDGFIYEFDNQNSKIFYWDTTQVQAPVDSVDLGSSTLIFNSEMISFSDRLIMSLDTDQGNFLVSMYYNNKAFSGGGTENSQFGANSFYQYINRVSETAFIAYDSLNNRLIRFEEDAQTTTGFSAVKEIDMSGFILASDVGAVGARRDFEVYYVWDKSDNSIKRFNPDGTAGPEYDFDEQTDITGRDLTIEDIIVEDNARVVVAVDDQPSGSAKLAQTGNKRLVFLGGGFQYLGNVEMPVGGSRGDYSKITDLDVDYDGNIYIAHEDDRKIRMLDGLNHTPINNNSTQVARILINDKSETYPINAGDLSFQDWNIEDTLTFVRLQPQLSTNSVFELLFDANNDGVFDSSEELNIDNTDSVDISAKDIQSGKLVLKVANQAVVTPGGSTTFIRYKWGDGSGFNPEVKGNYTAEVLGTKIEINGVSGKDGWRLLAPSRSGISYGELLEPLWTQGASGSDLPLGSPNIFNYNTAEEIWEPVTDLSEKTELGKGFAMFIYEDDDLNTPGVQGGWPKVITPNIDSSAISRTLQFEFDLAYDSSAKTPQFPGFNLVGVPYTTPIQWLTARIDTASISETAIYWEAAFNNGLGRYVYRPLTYGSDPELHTLSPGQGFWIEATAPNPYVKLVNSVTSGERPIPKANQSTQQITITVEDAGFGDELKIYSSEIRSKKLNSLSDSYHEIYGIGEFGKPLAITNSDFSDELNVSLGIRSSLFDHATISLDQSTLNEAYKDIVIEQELLNGELLFHQFENGIGTIPLIQKNNIWVQEGTLTLKAQRFSSVSNEPDTELPVKFEVGAYPNPFNPTTNIRYALPEAGELSIEVFNVVGQRVATLISREQKSAGVYNLQLDLSAQSSGVYFVRVAAKNAFITRKITLIK